MAQVIGNGSTGLNNFVWEQGYAREDRGPIRLESGGPFWYASENIEGQYIFGTFNIPSTDYGKFYFIVKHRTGEPANGFRTFTEVMNNPVNDSSGLDLNTQNKTKTNIGVPIQDPFIDDIGAQLPEGTNNEPVTAPLTPGSDATITPPQSSADTLRTYELYINMPKVGLSTVSTLAYVNKPVNQTITAIEETAAGYVIRFQEDYQIAQGTSLTSIAALIIGGLAVFGIVTWKLIETTNNTARIEEAGNARDLGEKILSNPGKYGLTPEEAAEIAGKLFDTAASGLDVPEEDQLSNMAGTLIGIVPIIAALYLLKAIKR